MSFIRAAAYWAVLGLLAAVLMGCATAGGPSDVPWNVPQPWEGVPSLPGDQQ
ncbi:MAG: hypothetical protein HYV35_12190 [Lentisphaerae bacterium]|nr:hypothetical protein [Lentisphaerota bacterium]